MKKIFNLLQGFSGAEKKTLYRQAAFFYALNALVFLSMFSSKAPFHNFGLWSTALFTAGVVMMVIFTILIYRGYRRVTLFLASIALIRLVITILKIPLFTYIIVLVLVLEGLTCIMLFRAPLGLTLKGEKVKSEGE